MRLRYVLPMAIVLGLGVASLAIASTRDGHHGKQNGTTFTAFLRGGYETPLSIHTNGTGKLTLSVDTVKKTMTFTLTYSGLSSPAQVAHVHFGQPATTGGVSFFFCGGAKPACPAGTTTTATVTGTVGTADILGPTAQGIPVGGFDEIVQEMRAGFTYANVHTTNYPTGEIRGQLNGHQDDDEDDD